MVEVAAHLADHVLPPLPLRQWVLSLPKRIRLFLPHDPRPAGDVLRVLLRGIRTALRHASPPAPGGAQLGAVSFLHRFGSTFVPHLHFHVVVLDGVFSEGDDGSVTFHEATHLDADDVLRLERTLKRRVLRLFQRRGLLTEATVEDMLTWQAAAASAWTPRSASMARTQRGESASCDRVPAAGGWRAAALRAGACVSSAAARGSNNAPPPQHTAMPASAKSSTCPRDPPATAAPSSPSRPLSFSPCSPASSRHLSRPPA
jgi:hypothetical protein